MTAGPCAGLRGLAVLVAGWRHACSHVSAITSRLAHATARSLLAGIILMLGHAGSTDAAQRDRPDAIAPAAQGAEPEAQTVTGPPSGDPELRTLFARARAGDPAAQNALGEKFENGEGVARDPTAAARWYRLAAEQGYAAAQLNLGVLYENGEGVQRDLREAVRWYAQAAAAGEVVAQLTLGLFYREGRGVPVDYGKAVRWFRAVADQGFAIGQINLAFMYLTRSRRTIWGCSMAPAGACRATPSALQSGTRGRPARAWPMPSTTWGWRTSAGKGCLGTMSPPRTGIGRRRNRGKSRRRPSWA